MALLLRLGKTCFAAYLAALEDCASISDAFASITHLIYHLVGRRGWKSESAQ